MASGFPLCQCPTAGTQHKSLLYHQPGHHTTPWPLTCSWYYQFGNWICLHFPDVLFQKQLQCYSKKQHYYLYISFSEPRFSTPWHQSSIFSSQGINYLTLKNISSPSFGFISLALGFWFLCLLHFLFSSLAEEKWRQLYFSLLPWHQHWALSYFFTRFTYFPYFLYPLPSIQKHMQHQTKSKQLHQWLPTL